MCKVTTSHTSTQNFNAKYFTIVQTLSATINSFNKLLQYTSVMKTSCRWQANGTGALTQQP